MVYELRIDIEQVDPNGDCSRPVFDVLLCESADDNVIEKNWTRLQSLFPVVDCDGIKVKGKAVYTVFVGKIDEQEKTDYYEEIDLARFTSLKNAKVLMKEVINNQGR